MDTLVIKGLNVITTIGANTWEKQIMQRLLLDISIPVDFADCGDQLERTLDYDKLCTATTRYLEQQSFQLIESVANHLALFLKNEFKLREISITVHKPQAIKNAQSISVSATR